MLNLTKESPFSYGVISFLSGMLLGHWLAIGRDRRTEFNTAASPIRKALLIQIDKARTNNQTIHRYTVNRDDFIVFCSHVSILSQRKYKYCVKQYFCCFDTPQHVAASGMVYKQEPVDRVALEKSIKGLLKYFELR